MRTHFSRTAGALALAIALAIAPISASAQDAGGRLAAESLAGVGGALGLGLVGMTTGMAGSLLIGPNKIEPAPPIVGAVLGGSLGMIGGVALAGLAAGGDGTVGGTTAGFLVGAAATGAMWGIATAATRREARSSGKATTLMVMTVLLPLVGSMAGFEM